MNRARGGVLVGLMYSLPVVIWTLTGLNPGASEATGLAPAVAVLLLVQAIAIALYAPECAIGATGWEGVTGILLTQLTPLPLLALVWSSGGPDAGRLGLGQAVLLGYGWLVLAMATGLVRWVPTGWQRLSLSFLQGSTAAAVWAFRQEWAAWLG
jgi:hypothetical protein